jgi:hypothetical protein
VEYARYEERRNAGMRQSEKMMVKRMETGTLAPTW